TGDTIAMSVEEGSVRLWDLAGESVKTSFNAHRSIVWSSLFSSNGELFATAGDDALVKVWKLSQPEPVKVFEHSNAVRGLTWSHDNRLLFAGSRDGKIRVWPVEADTPLAEAQQPGAVYSVAVSPDDQIVATAGNEKVVRLWN